MFQHRSTYTRLLRECGDRKALENGMSVHSHIIKSGLANDTFLCNQLIIMYSKCQKLIDARSVFDKMVERNVVSWNVMIYGYVRNGYGRHAFQLFQELQHQGLEPNSVTFTTILNSFATPDFLSFGKLIHGYIVHCELESNVVVSTALVCMYGKCRSIKDARRLFNKMPERNVVSWNVMITAYAKHGYGEEAFRLFQQMLQDGVQADTITFTSILSVFSSRGALPMGKLVHASAFDSRYASDISVANTLVSMYGKCGSIEDAWRLFHTIPERDVTTWTTMIVMHTQHGRVVGAIKLLQQMQHEGLKMNKVNYISILNACACPEALAVGERVHEEIIERSFALDPFLGTALVSMYGRCGDIVGAREIFDTMPERDIVSWNAMISGYAAIGYWEEAFKLFEQMQKEGRTPDKATFISVLNACATRSALTLGRVVHTCIIDVGVELDVCVGTALVNMYCKCGSVEDASRMFDMMPNRNVVSWNAMIAGFMKDGCAKEAWNLFQQMQKQGMKPDSITFVSILGICGSSEALALGKLVHAHAICSQIESDIAVGNALISMYFRCGSIEDAWGMFKNMHERNIVSWTAMIAGYAQYGHAMEALQLFQQMQQEGMKPDKVTFISVLNACGRLAALADGKLIHSYVVNVGMESDIVLGTALVSMYNGCSNIVDAKRIFDNMPERNVVSWNAMIAGYVQNGHGKEALKLFEQMHREGVKPDRITFISLLDACTSFAAIMQGKLLHNYIVDSGIESDIDVGNALISMYYRCGNIHDARKMFEKMPERDVVSWNAIIAGYSQHGHGEEALQLFKKMQAVGLNPNAITYIGVLAACGHAGLLDQGLDYYCSMIKDLDIMPMLEHYNCIVVLLGRAGWLDEAEEFIRNMPFQPSIVTWISLLGSSRTYGYIDLGRLAAECALQLDPQSTSACVVLSNIYAATGRWDDVVKVREMIADRSVLMEQ